MKGATPVADETYGSGESVYDYWSGSKLAVPSISGKWFDKVGDGFDDAVLLPCPDPNPTGKDKYFGMGYQIVPQREPDKIPDPTGKTRKMVDNPKAGQPRRFEPRGQQTVGNIIPQTVLWLAIPNLPDPTAFMSDRMIEKFKDASQAGDPDDLEFIAKVKKFGLRRLFIAGKSMDQGSRKAIKAVSGTPKQAHLISVHLSALVGNDYGGETKEYDVVYKAATADSTALVNEYLKDPVVVELREQGEDRESDPWGGASPAPERGSASPTPAYAGRAAASEDETPF